MPRRNRKNRTAQTPKPLRWDVLLSRALASVTPAPRTDEKNGSAK